MYGATNAGERIEISPRARLKTVQLDLDGVIIHADKAWRDWALDHGMSANYRWDGKSYLAAAQATLDDPTVSEAIRLVELALQGDLASPRTILTPCAATGTSGWFDMQTSSRFDAEDRCVGATVSFEECTSADRLAAVLDLLSKGAFATTGGAESAASLGKSGVQLILDSIPVALALVDDQGLITMCNDHLTTMFDYGTDVLGHSFDSMLRTHEQDGPLWIDRCDRESCSVGFSTATITIDSQASSLIVISNLTAQHQLERGVEDLKTEIISTLSHELRTPLTSIIGYAELLEDNIENDPDDHQFAQHSLSVIKRNAQRELDLVEDFLALRELGVEPGQLQCIRVDLIDLSREHVEAFQSVAHSQDIDLTLDWTEPCFAWGDRKGLGQLLDKLIDNAIKFSGPSTHVAVHLRVDGLQSVIEVSDEGPGIDADLLPLIFNRLHRGPEAIRESRPGLGLGLAVAAAITEAHFGRIRAITRAPKAGTSLIVVLPAPPATAADAADHAADSASTDTSASSHPLPGRPSTSPNAER